MTETAQRNGPESGPLPSNNIFSAPWDIYLGMPDLAAVVARKEDLEPALRAGMAEQRAQWEAVATNPEPATIANTLVPLQLSGKLLERASTALSALTSATSCPDLDQLEERLAPELASHYDAYTLDQRLYRRFKDLEARVLAAREQGAEPQDADGAPIDAPTARLIKHEVEDFEHGGIALDPERTERLRQINARLTELGARFGSLATQAMQEAEVANYTSPPALATTTPHTARVDLLERSMSRGLSGRTDTRQIVVEQARLRAERAQMLGFPHHAALVAAESAAGTTQAVQDMLAPLVEPAMANARRDAATYAARMEADPQTLPGEVFGPADWPRYENQERKERFGVDDAVLAPYLELWNVVERGVFYAASQLYGLSFHEREDLSAHMYDPSVRVWEVRDEHGAVLGLFVGDYYAREGKHGGAWMSSLTTASQLEGTRPVVINCLNVAPAVDGPTLLTWDEVTTCFHEFGHALHGLLTDVYWPSQSGTNVPQDVVEYPSQVNECWALHPQVLASYARHVRTGEPLPAALVEKLQAQGSFGQGYATTEYLGAALLDQAWHTLRPQEAPTEPEQVEAFEQAALEAAGIDPSLVPPRYRSTYFGHIFTGGYAAAYYAYIWSEVMDADTVDWLRNEACHDGDQGLNRGAGDRLRRELLSRGDTREAAESYRALTGRDPRTEPLLRRRALAHPQPNHPFKQKEKDEHMTRVTIVGGGYGGIAAAKALDPVAQVTLVEQKDTFVNHAAALRAAVDRQWADKIFLPYDNLLTNGRVVRGTVMSVRGTTVSVSGVGQIEADHLILATGTSYPFPAKHMESSAVIAKARIERAHAGLEEAKKVLVVGGGDVGTELAGEITSAFPDTEVILLEAAEDILPNRDYKPELRESIRFQLIERGVEIITGDKLAALPPVDPGVLSRFRVTTKKGSVVEADMWFRAYGASASTGYLGTDYDDIRHYDGTIRVDDHLRVVDHPGVWAIGDITDVRETKRADAARAHAEVVAANISEMIAGRPASKVYTPQPELVVLPLGPDGGASQVLKDGVRVVVGPEETARIKGGDLFSSFVSEALGLKDQSS